MNITANRTLQTQLIATGADPGDVTGRIVPATRAAVAQTLERIDPATKTDWRTWTVGRRDVLCLQALCLEPRRESQGHVQDEILFQEAPRAAGAFVRTAVTRIDDDGVETIGPGLRRPR